MPKLAVVTGASGFIGRHLVRSLVAAGWRVRVLARVSSPAASPGEGVERRVVDYRERIDPGHVEGADAVFHLAGATRAGSAQGFHRGNVEPTRRLLVAAEESGGGPRFVYISSQAAFGPASSAQHPITEASEPRPIEDYGHSKLAAEEVVRRGRCPYTILRPSSVYGSGDRDFAVIFHQIRLGLAIYATDPDGLVSMIHVRDLVRGIVTAAESEGAAGDDYFLTAEPPRSWLEVYGAVATLLGRRPLEARVPPPLLRAAARVGDLVGRISGEPLLINSRKIRLAEPLFWICSGRKAARELGFEATVGLEEGLSDYLR